MRIDRRNKTTLGRKRRREFDRSVDRLRALGMPDWAVEYFRRAGRVASLPPHMIVCHVAVVAAGRQLQASIVQDQQGVGVAPAQEPGRTPRAEAPSYASVRMMRQRVANLWREIERRGSLIDAAADGGNAEAGTRPERLSASKFADKLTLLRAEAPNSNRATTRPRRRKATAGKSH